MNAGAFSAAINRAIAPLGLKVRAARAGNRYLGYSYFIDATTGDQVGESVSVFRQSELSIHDWIREARAANATRPGHVLAQKTELAPAARALFEEIKTFLSHGYPSSAESELIEKIDNVLAGRCVVTASGQAAHTPTFSEILGLKWTTAHHGYEDGVPVYAVVRGSKVFAENLTESDAQTIASAMNDRNAHAELVEALNGVITYALRLDAERNGYQANEPECVQQARAALAKAQGGAS